MFVKEDILGYLFIYLVEVAVLEDGLFVFVKGVDLAWLSLSCMLAVAVMVEESLLLLLLLLLLVSLERSESVAIS